MPSRVLGSLLLLCFASGTEQQRIYRPQIEQHARTYVTKLCLAITLVRSRRRRRFFSRHRFFSPQIRCASPVRYRPLFIWSDTTRHACGLRFQADSGDATLGSRKVRFTPKLEQRA